MPESKCYLARIAVVSLAVVPILLIGALWTLPGVAQAAAHCHSSHSPDLAKVLSFDVPPVEKVPGDWYGGPEGTVFLAARMSHKGQKVVLLSLNNGGVHQFSAFDSCAWMGFTGKKITLQGYLRTKDVSGYAGLWMKEYGGSEALASDDMQTKNLHGTTGWKKYSITLPKKVHAVWFSFGVLLQGSGKVWVSGLQLLVDGKPIWKAPQIDIPFYTDHQFDKGSGIAINRLDKTQIANLVTLGKVWGFLKYYDPTVTAGKRQWDYDLFRIMPTILKAKDQEKANASFVQWIKKLGPVKPCKPCAHLKTKNIQLRPDLGWIHDQKRLGKKLSGQLQDIYKNRRTGKQFYVSLVSGAGNPFFEHELPYGYVKFPDSGFQLLALYRFWNIIEYWYPDRNVIGENWNKVLTEFIPRLALAKSRKDYELQMMALIAKIHDTHANLWSSLEARPPIGKCHLPVRIRYVQKQPVVTEYEDGKQASDSPFQIGDAIVKLDGKPVSELFKEWAPYYGASNKAALRREIAVYMTRGTCGDTTVAIRRDGTVMRIEAKRVPVSYEDLGYGTRDLAGPAFRLLSPNVAYLKISTAKKSQEINYFKRATGTKGLIIDLRGYPSSYDLTLAAHLVNRLTPVTIFTEGSLTTPGAFYYRNFPVSDVDVEPRKPHYAGKVVVLVDNTTQSYSEFLALALRAAGGIVVGSTTAGADGSVSPFYLPGWLRTLISGIGVVYPDKKPTQRIGIVPDVVVKPTIADIRAGRDPVLEKAIRLIVGSKVPEAKIRKMYRTQSEKAQAPGST
ncbi:MAG: S41 family peptidase [Gammaproteobacteria bacterium]